MKNIFFILLIIFITGCKLDNRVRVVKLHASLVSIDSTSVGECYKYVDFDLEGQQTSICFWFEIEYVSDGDKNEKFMTYQREGGDGPIHSIDNIHVFLLDSVDNKIEITSFLFNDSSYNLYELPESIGNKIHYGHIKEVKCPKPDEYNCHCDHSNIYASVSNFIKAFNERKKTVCYRELESPHFWHLNESKLSKLLSSYKKLVFEIQIDDGSVLKDEYNIQK